MVSIPTSATEREGAIWPSGERTRCWQCGTDQASQLFCSACGAIQALPERANYFQVLGLPTQLVIDLAALQGRYYDLHRQLHPDLYQTGPQEARVASLRNTATVNRAYQTLRDPVDRGLYWLALRGESLGHGNNRVPADLAALVFETQEKLEELRAARTSNGSAAALGHELAAEHEALRARHAALLRQLEANFARWDSGAADPAVLTHELKTILSALAYLATLIRDVDAALET